MKSLRLLTLLLWALLPVCTRGANADSTAAARAALEKATTYYRATAVSGGYPWWSSLDFTQRVGSVHDIAASQVYVGPPGTTTVGEAFLEAYAATQDPRYLDAAQETADGLAWGQLESGGWQYLIDFDPVNATRYYRRLEIGTLTPAEIAARSNATTFDDDVTPGALRFMIKVIAASGNDTSARLARIRSAVDYGLNGLMEAQYPNGAWPQGYEKTPRNAADFPVIPVQVPGDWPRVYPNVNYHSFYTINDDVHINCMGVLLDAKEKLGRTDCEAAARKAGDFLILAQLPQPHPGWAQQYNFAMEPVWARQYEPPAAVSRETANVILALMRLKTVTGDNKYQAPITAAAAWLRRSQIAPGMWAFFYELETGRPLYVTPDSQLTYSNANVITTYTMFGDLGIPISLASYERARRQGAAFFQSKPVPRRTETETGALKAIASLDSLGRWVSNGRLESKTYANNVHFLCRYLIAQ